LMLPQPEQRQRQRLKYFHTHNRQLDKIFILGSGPSLAGYKYQSGDIVWCPYSMLDDAFKDKISQVFGMHAHETGLIEGIIDQTNYPLDDIIKKYGSCFFTCTISYMIAYALFIGVKEIELHGVDLNGTREYIAERPSVFYWLGLAEGLGVKITMSNNLNKPAFLYGYMDESRKELKGKISNLTAWAMTERDTTEDQRVKDQYTGFMLALDTINKEL
jgi:hypothetical protein